MGRVVLGGRNPTYSSGAGIAIQLSYLASVFDTAHRAEGGGPRRCLRLVAMERTAFPVRDFASFRVGVPTKNRCAPLSGDPPPKVARIALLPWLAEGSRLSQLGAGTVDLRSRSGAWACFARSGRDFSAPQVAVPGRIHLHHGEWRFAAMAESRRARSPTFSVNTVAKRTSSQIVSLLLSPCLPTSFYHHDSRRTAGKSPPMH